MVRGDLLSRARSGDGEAFRELAESHRRESDMSQFKPTVPTPRDEPSESLRTTAIGGWTQ